jgi:hypothetical protein
VFRSIGSALFDCRHLGPSTGPHWPAVLEGNIPLPFQFLPRVFDPPSLSSCRLLSRATPMGSIFCLARADRQSRQQQQRDRDGDHRDEDQRLNTRHAPHRAPPIVSEMVHNLGGIVCMQIYSYGAVARSPRFGALSTVPWRPSCGGPPSCGTVAILRRSPPAVARIRSRSQRLACFGRLVGHRHRVTIASTRAHHDILARHDAVEPQRP